MCIVFNLYQIF